MKIHQSGEDGEGGLQGALMIIISHFLELLSLHLVSFHIVLHLGPSVETVVGHGEFVTGNHWLLGAPTCGVPTPHALAFPVFQAHQLTLPGGPC